MQVEEQNTRKGEKEEGGGKGEGREKKEEGKRKEGRREEEDFSWLFLRNFYKRKISVSDPDPDPDLYQETLIWIRVPKKNTNQAKL